MRGWGWEGEKERKTGEPERNATPSKKKNKWTKRAAHDGIEKREKRRASSIDWHADVRSHDGWRFIFHDTPDYGLKSGHKSSWILYRYVPAGRTEVGEKISSRRCVIARTRETERERERAKKRPRMAKKKRGQTRDEERRERLVRASHEVLA